MKLEFWALVLAAALLAPAGGAAAAAPVAGPARACATLVGLSPPGLDLVVERAEAIPAGSTPDTPGASGPAAAQLSPYCHVSGAIRSRTGYGGVRYALRFALALPAEWNGRFLFQGGAGADGTVRPPLGVQAVGDTPALARGFAVVSTDAGHEGALFDPAFRRDQQAALDFAQDSVGVVAPAAKALIAAYYGRPPRRSYFVGCSTGGREAMLAVERYPDLFDGVVAGDPAMRTGLSNLADTWAAVAFNRAAPLDAAGRPEAARLFSPSDKRLLVGALLQTCDGLDGMKDGLIFAGGACRFDPAVLTCPAAKTDACLSKAQVAALQTAFAGPRTPGGVQVYPGFPYDTGIGAEGPGIPGILPSRTVGPRGPSTTATSLDVERETEAAQTDGVQHLVDTAYWTNLTTFFGHGGKLVFYHGLSDPWFSPNDTLDYYRRLAADNGGAAAVRASSRIFLVPGMGHCQGGAATLDRFDLLGPVVDWVEADKPPASVVATGASLPGQSRPLCAWPEHTHYSGMGDPKAASSYVCSP